MAIDVKNSNIVITGGSSGIGKLIATFFAKKGSQVAVWDLAKESGEQFQAELNKSMSRDGIKFFEVDVTNPEAVKQQAQKTLEWFDGKVDVLINNAGVVSGKSILDLKDSDIMRTMNVNAIAPFWVTRAFLPVMNEQQSGYIVSISSAAGLVGIAKQTDYSASKFAVLGFMEALRAELNKQGSEIKTLVVCPTYISTGMFEGVKPMSPLIPIMKPEYVARRIIKAIIKGEERLILPSIVKIMPAIKVLPVRLQDKVYSAFKINASMDDFVGHTQNGAEK
jgi:all-trans-retinol dehydrogenase (NAD+)